MSGSLSESTGWSWPSRRRPGPSRTSSAPRSTPVSRARSATSRRCGTAACCCCTTTPWPAAFFAALSRDRLCELRRLARLGPAAGGRARLFRRGGDRGGRRRLSARGHGAAHGDRRPHLFSLRHARPGRHRRRTRRSRSQRAARTEGGDRPRCCRLRRRAGLDDGVRRRADRASKVLRYHDEAETLRASMLEHLARERAAGTRRHPHRARPADFDASMPRFVTAFLAQGERLHCDKLGA